MTRLRIETFLEGIRDPEAGRYRVLAGLQAVQREFSSDRLYPTLAELITLYQNLTELQKAGSEVREGLPKRIVGLDLKSQKVLYETLSMSEDRVQAMEDLVAWAMPKIKSAIEEGQTIYNFVEKQMTLKEVGLVPSYVDEGYLLVPDQKNSRLHVVRYEVSIFTSSDQRFRNLKTTTVKTYDVNRLDATPWHVKQHLIRELRDLPNPATYTFSSDLEYPYDETLLPIAKRKLLRRLYS